VRNQLKVNHRKYTIRSNQRSTFVENKFESINACSHTILPVSSHLCNHFNGASMVKFHTYVTTTDEDVFLRGHWWRCYSL